MEVIVPRWMWERFKAGDLDQLRRMSEQGMKNVYGKGWEKELVVLRIEETGKAYVVGEGVKEAAKGGPDTGGENVSEACD